MILSACEDGDKKLLITELALVQKGKKGKPWRQSQDVFIVRRAWPVASESVCYFHVRGC
jgi:hypothetical protein